MEDKQIEKQSTITEESSLTVTEQNNSEQLAKLTKQIKSHISQTKQNFIEIGKCLIEAKTLIKHGEWENWLENNFTMTERTAQNLMKCAKRFGKNEIDFVFNSTQMIALLPLTEKETKNFIETKTKEGTPVAKMPIKTLRKEVKQWKSENKKTTPVKNYKNKDNGTIDITPTVINQEQKTIPSAQKNSQDSEQHETKQQDSTINIENQSAYDTYQLLEQLLNLSTKLVNTPNLNEFSKKYAKNNPDKFKNEINNLLSIINMISPTPSEK